MTNQEPEVKIDIKSIKERFSKYLTSAEPRNSDDFSAVGLICNLIGEYKNAITALTKAIELDPENISAYGHRADSYLQINDYEHAVEDLNKVIKSTTEENQLQNAYLRRSVVYQIKDDEKKALSDLSKAIKLCLKESDAYAQRAEVHKRKNNYKHAIEDYSHALTLDPNNSGLYIARAETYWHNRNDVDALKDFILALELHHDENSVIEFIEGPLHNISNTILPEEMSYGHITSDFPLSTLLTESYNKIVDIYPDLPGGYLHRGIYWMITTEYANALSDFFTFLRFNNDDVFVIFLQGVCNDHLKNKEQATKHFQKVVQHSAIDNISKIKAELAKYPPIDNGIDYNLFLSVIGQITSIEETLLALFSLFDLATLLDQKGKSRLSHELLSAAKYLDTLISNPDIAISVPGTIVNDIFYHYPEYTVSPKTVLLRDGVPIFTINVKLSIIEYIVVQVDILNFGEIEDIPFEQANGFFYRFHEKDLNLYSNLVKNPVHFYKQLQSQLNEIIRKKLNDEAQARLEERNKVIADLSHSIKNLIATVIDPLENMKKEEVYKPIIIQNALRGANLVREIVNAMNLSFKGSLDDFYFDARHNTGKDSMALDSLVMESIKYSVSNMFDGKYFSNFMQKYFPTRSIFNEAKSAWRNISQMTNRQDLMSFLENYFFRIEVSTGTANQYILGNEKGSAIKILILFQELILNAVKYSAFAPRDQRFLNIELVITHSQLSIRVTNRFREDVAVKTSGIGHVIIENFSKLLLTRPEINTSGDIYTIEIKFANFWGKTNENLIRGG